MFVAVPDELGIEQVECVEVAGGLASFSSSETWMTVGGKRVLRLAPSFFSETKALEKGYELSAYPLVASSEELDALLVEVQPWRNCVLHWPGAMDYGPLASRCNKKEY